MKKRLLAWILALVMLAALLPTAVLAEDKPTSGTCGAAGSESSVTWKLEQNNDDNDNPTYTLTISGTGAMADYGGYKGQPWAAFANSITKFVVEEGVTTIGQSATDGEGMIEEYDIAKSVATIKKYGISTYAATKFTLNDNPNFKLVDGVLFSTDGSTLYAYPGGREEIDVYEVPTNVTKINGGAFNGADMKKLIFGNSTINIESWTFQGCTAEYMELNGTKLSGSEPFRHLTKLKVLKIAGGFIPGQFFCGVNSDLSPTAAIEKIIITELPSGGNAFFLQNKLTTVDLSQCSNAANASKNFFSGTNASKIAFYFDSDENAAGFKDTSASAYESQNAVFAVLNGGIIPSWEGWYSKNFKLATPIRDGYKFTGWYKNEACTETVTADDPAAGQTYYAGWEESADKIPGKDEGKQMAVDLGSAVYGETPSATVLFEGSDELKKEVKSNYGYFDADIDGMTVTIKPAADLQPGTYTDTLYVCTAGGAVHFITVTVKIVPKPADPDHDEPEPALPSWVSALPALEGSKKLPFTDVWRGDWYYDGVRYVYDNNLMNGTSGTEFSPNAATTRGMIVTILARLDGVNTSGTPWYAAGREWAMQNGISDGTNMEGKITREQLAAMLCRYAKLKGCDVSASADISGYVDASAVSDWASGAMRWAVSQSLIQGSNSRLRPQANATRAEVATILMRFCELLKK